MSKFSPYKIGDYLTYTDRDYEGNIIFQGEGKLIYIDDDSVCRNLVLFKMNLFDAENHCYIDSNMHRVHSGLLAILKIDDFERFILPYSEDDNNRIYWCADGELTLGPPVYYLQDLLKQLENETKA